MNRREAVLGSALVGVGILLPPKSSAAQDSQEPFRLDYPVESWYKHVVKDGLYQSEDGHQFYNIAMAVQHWGGPEPAWRRTRIFQNSPHYPGNLISWWVYPIGYKVAASAYVFPAGDEEARHVAAKSAHRRLVELVITTVDAIPTLLTNKPTKSVACGVIHSGGFFPCGWEHKVFRQIGLVPKE